MTAKAARELDYGIMQAVQALIKLEAMKQQNEADKRNDRFLTYPPESFDKLIDDLGLHHNALLTRWEGINE